ncbi:aldehyde dehydrogenase family protein, partial [Oleiphilus sp. HI0079]
MSNLGLLINGKWQEGSGPVLESTNPYTQERVWSATTANSDDVDHAISAARSAFVDWARTSFEQRVALVERFKEQLQTNTEALADAIGKETGKPLWESRTEVAAMIGKVGISIQAYNDRTGS